MNTRAGTPLAPIALAVIVIVLLITFIYDQQDNSQSAIDNTVISTFAKVTGYGEDDIPSIDSSAEFIDKPTADYVKWFTERIFQQQIAGAELKILPQPIYAKKYPLGQSIRIGQRSDASGVIITLEDADGKNALAASAKKDIYLRNTTLCVLPKDGRSSDAKYVIHSITGIPMDDKTDVNMEEILQNNEVSQVRIGLSNTAPLSYTNGDDKVSESLRFGPEKDILVARYEASYTTYVCFFPVDTYWFDDVEYNDGVLEDRAGLDTSLVSNLPENKNIYRGKYDENK